MDAKKVTTDFDIATKLIWYVVKNSFQAQHRNLLSKTGYGVGYPNILVPLTIM